MKFKYKSFGETLRPVIPITLIHKGVSVESEAIVDSGSDHCFFDAEVGNSLGITTSNSEIKEVFGIGGNASLYYVHPVKVRLGDTLLDIKAGFVSKIGGQVFRYGVLGQEGFFDRFVVRFDLSKEMVELKEIK